MSSPIEEGVVEDIGVQVHRLSEQVAAVGQAVLAVTGIEDASDWTAAHAEEVARATERLTEIAGQLATVTAAVQENYQWQHITADPAIIARVAHHVTRSGFQTIGTFYRRMVEDGLMPPGMPTSEVRIWFDEIKHTVQAHVTESTGRRTLWLHEHRTWVLSYLESPKQLAEIAEEEPIKPASASLLPPPVLPVTPPPVPRPIPQPPAQPSAPPKPERPIEDPAFTEEELRIASAVADVLSGLGTTDRLTRPALLASLRSNLTISRSNARAFDPVAKTLIRRMVRRGHIDSVEISSGGFSLRLAGEIRSAWRKQSRESLLAALKEVFDITAG